MSVNNLGVSDRSCKPTTADSEIVSEFAPAFAAEFDDSPRLCGLLTNDEQRRWAAERARRRADYSRRVELANMIDGSILPLAPRRRGPVPPRSTRRAA